MRRKNNEGDGMITKEEALKKHREMWTAMQKELGDCPRAIDRLRFKWQWCRQHEDNPIDGNCYLCQYVSENKGCVNCGYCPIDWGDEIYGCMGQKVNYRDSPISVILARPERKNNG